MNKRVHIYYSGRVQGVGFRFSVERLATDLGISGWVKNLHDGRVELVGEGEQGSLDKMIANINAEFSAYIRRREINWMPANSEFTNFEIRFF